MNRSICKAHSREWWICVQGCTWPPLATHTCSSWFAWQAGRGAQHRGRGRPGRETAAHHDVQGCPHARGDTLPRHMRRGQREGESGTHEEEANAVKSQEDRHKQKEDRDGMSLRGDRAWASRDEEVSVKKTHIHRCPYTERRGYPDGLVQRVWERRLDEIKWKRNRVTLSTGRIWELRQKNSQSSG